MDHHRVNCRSHAIHHSRCQAGIHCHHALAIDRPRSCAVHHSRHQAGIHHHRALAIDRQRSCTVHHSRRQAGIHRHCALAIDRRRSRAVHSLSIVFVTPFITVAVKWGSIAIVRSFISIVCLLMTWNTQGPQGMEWMVGSSHMCFYNLYQKN